MERSRHRLWRGHLRQSYAASTWRSGPGPKVHKASACYCRGGGVLERHDEDQSGKLIFRHGNLSKIYTTPSPRVSGRLRSSLRETSKHFADALHFMQKSVDTRAALYQKLMLQYRSLKSEQHRLQLKLQASEGKSLPVYQDRHSLDVVFLTRRH